MKQINITSEELMRRYGEVSLERDRLDTENGQLKQLINGLQSKIKELEAQSVGATGKKKA